MNKKASFPSKAISQGIDLKRTERPYQKGENTYWDGDTLVYVGIKSIRMNKALSHFSPTMKESFKQNATSFLKQGKYSFYSHIAHFERLRAQLNTCPTTTFNAKWIAQALTNSSFLRFKSGILQFFLYWHERDSAAISKDALRLLDDSASIKMKRRNVLSDDPEKSWLSDEEYEHLLRATWNNYDCGACSTQVTLIRLMSMQYARRPVQIAYLKVGDIHENDDSASQGLIGRVVNFPGVKDRTTEHDFRDSKFETHPLADHLWDLCTIQRGEVKALYEHTLGLALTDDQLKQMPLFCSETQIKAARQLIEKHYQINLLENLDSRLFHIKTIRITRILIWSDNTPNCNFTADKPLGWLRTKPPISHRTGRTMIVNATRMRHTRIRQLARQGVPKHMLSHWLGHTSERSLDSYYNDPPEIARQLDDAMAPALLPLAMAFAGTLIDSEDQASRANDPNSKLEFAKGGELRSVGRCGKHSFCAITSVPIPCYRCKHFEPLVDAPHQEVLEALVQRQAAEKQPLKIGGLRNLLMPIDLSADIRAVENCIARCSARKAERE